MSPDPTPSGGSGGDGLPGRRPVAHVLAGLRDGVAAPPPRSPATARRAATRRQGTRLAGAAVAVALVIVGVPLGVSLTGTEAAPAPVATREPIPTEQEPTQPPAPPVPSAVTSMLPTPAPATRAPEPVTTPTVAAEPSVPAVEETVVQAVPPLQVSPSGSGGVSTGELAGLELARLDLMVDEVDLVDPATGGASWALDPCLPTDWPLDRARTGWASLRWWVGDAGGTREVATYATEAEAVEQLEAFRRVATACWSPPTDQGARWLWQETTPPGQESAVFAGMVREVYPAAGVGAWPNRDGAFWVALREGRTVALVAQVGHYAGGVIAVYQGDLREGTGAALVADTTSQEDAAASVRENLGSTRAGAQEVLDAAVGAT